MTRVRRRHVGHVGPAHVQQAAQRHVQHSVDGRARVRLLAAARPQRAAAVLRGDRGGRGGRGGADAAERRGVTQHRRGRGGARGERAAAAAPTWPLQLEGPHHAARAAAAAQCAARARQWR